MKFNMQEGKLGDVESTKKPLACDYPQVGSWKDNRLMERHHRGNHVKSCSGEETLKTPRFKNEVRNDG